MQDVFKLRSADIYRVVRDRAGARARSTGDASDGEPRAGERRGVGRRLAGAEHAAGAVPRPRLARRAPRSRASPSCSATSTRCCCCSTSGGERLYTIASHGYDDRGRRLGGAGRRGHHRHGRRPRRADAGRATCARCWRTRARCGAPTRSEGGAAPGLEIPLPGLPDAESQVAVPAMVLGQLVGVLAIESEQPRSRSTPIDEALLSVVASMVASAIEIDRAQERAAVRRARPVDGRRRAGGDPARSRPTTTRAVLRGRRQHVPRRRLPHQGRRRPHPVGAARPPRRATAASSSPTRRCGSTRRSSCPSSATTSRAA